MKRETTHSKTRKQDWTYVKSSWAPITAQKIPSIRTYAAEVIIIMARVLATS